MALYERFGHDLYHASPLGNALYVIRLRRKPFRSAGRWYRIPFAARVSDIRWELDRAKRSRAEPTWLPDEGRESPREEWMSWRRSFGKYTAGAMRFNHGKAPPLVGRARLYDLSSPRVSPFD